MWWSAADEPQLVQYVRHPNFGAYHARLEKLLTLAGAGRPCWSAYVRPVAHLRHELTPCRQDKSGTSVGTAVCHRNHETEIDAPTIVIDTSTKWRATAPPTAPARRDGFIVFRIPGGMNARAVRPIMKQIRRALWAAAKQQVQPEEAAKMLEVVPPERRFLLYNRDAQLDRDLERYRLYAHEGLRFRAIALIECSTKAGRPLKPEQIPRTISMVVPGENAVRMAVRRIYAAVYLKPMVKGRRRRIDAPAEGMPPYHCEKHGQDCSQSFERFQSWWKRVSRTLPTPTTGKLRGEIAHPEGSLRRRA
jgi:hypothetical protein